LGEVRFARATGAHRVRGPRGIDGFFSMQGLVL
jgi:hypothetical protein